ncbi:MAG: hypothetical protein A3A44_01660 [Candidatus Sungbacteria bacterium RIFCSPLOWO2_01_FULL_60_25]|uniref:Adenylate kinase n=1 Tax=Candidatus Sungbacteria bacterium RIFCSPLOWO2_01_FULL_60_25 TaxID=1802281 RepID=A0A1G2LFF8_9BACT|nr:MAG: hypothetical protein A3A44_01660 [Candidatus Sungbacteria bacterium RIFCSPLOWO2_01_FULL_60_25]
MNMNRRRLRSAKTYVILGVSGSGKDTQAGLLLKALPKAYRISTGDSMRKMVKRKNAVGRYVAGVLSRGGLLPAWTPIYLWLAEFAEKLDGDESVFFTSGPRRIEEAKLLDRFLNDIGRPAPVALYLRIPASVAAARLRARGRHDDTPAAIRGRVAFFNEHVRPVIAYYRRSGRLIEVNGDQPVLGVSVEIKRKLHLR